MLLLLWQEGHAFISPYSEPTVHPCGFGMDESHVMGLCFSLNLFFKRHEERVDGPRFKMQNDKTKGRMGFPIRYRGCSGENTPRVSP